MHSNMLKNMVLNSNLNINMLDRMNLVIIMLLKSNSKTLVTQMSLVTNQDNCKPQLLNNQSQLPLKLIHSVSNSTVVVSSMMLHVEPT
jgi:hypothetical protein